jgi:hypothetical protein
VLVCQAEIKADFYKGCWLGNLSITALHEISKGIHLIYIFLEVSFIEGHYEVPSMPPKKIN